MRCSIQTGRRPAWPKLEKTVYLLNRQQKEGDFGMSTTIPFQALANGVLVAHVALVAFVVGGLACIIAGNLLGWRWVNRMGFRVAHMTAIVVVIAESWARIACPLTTLESWLRARAGSTAYSGGFIEHWLQRLLFYEAPWWVFAAAYSAFGVLVAATWWYYPPGREHKT